MMKIYKYPDKKNWKELTARPVMDDNTINKKVEKILAKVKSRGDKAIRHYTEKLDGIILENFTVSEEEINAAAAQVPEELKKAIAIARQNIHRFHRSQKHHSLRIETMPGIVCWRKKTPIEKIGLYIPGGSAPLFSTVLMLAVPATIAGCKEIILCTPPSIDGKIHPAILYTAQLCGITKIFKLGGAQAIAAMTYGTETIPPVFKIFGPGNQYVTTAKMLVQLEGLAIDMPAGPSELLVIADDSADPDFIAADLLSQAEHGPDSQVMLVTNNMELASRVTSSLKEQLSVLPRKKIAEKALGNSTLVILETNEDILAFSNLYAPEHLVIITRDASLMAEKIISAGSVFIGPWSPESAGDYATGTNHTLPTNGFAAMYSGITIESFMKTISFQQLSKEGFEKIAETVMVMAEAEGLAAHTNAVAIRLKKLHK